MGAVIVILLLVAFMLGGQQSVAKSASNIEVSKDGTMNCNAAATGSLYLSSRNTKNYSLQYVSASYIVTNSLGETIGTGTGTPGTSESLSAVTIPCDQKNANGIVWVIGSATNTSTQVPYKFTGGSSITVKADNQMAGAVTVTLLNSSGDADSTGSTTSSALWNATAMAQGNTISGYLKIQQSGVGGVVFGSETEGVLFSIDVNQSSKFSNKALSLQSAPNYAITEVPCPASAVQAHGADRCYKGAQITSEMGEIKIPYTLVADIGNPASSQDPGIYLDDFTNFQDTDGKIKNDIANSAATDVGVNDIVAVVRVS